MNMRLNLEINRIQTRNLFFLIQYPKLNRNFVILIMTDQKTDETTLQFVAAFLKSQKGKYDDTHKHLDKILGSHGNQNEELVWFFKACMFQKRGKIEQSNDCLKIALMSFDYHPNITSPTMEFISSNSIQHHTPKLDYIV